MGEIGITEGQETIEKIARTLPDFSSIRYFVNVPSSGFADIYPANYGVCEIDRIDYSRILVRYTAERNQMEWLGDFYLGSTPAWKGWVPIATAEPPTEYNLPLASGVTAYRPCQYSKTQDGIVIINMAIIPTAAIAHGAIIATLPAGHRPSQAIEIPCIEKGHNEGTLCVMPSGAMMIFMLNSTPIAANHYCFFPTISFLAAQ